MAAQKYMHVITQEANSSQPPPLDRACSDYHLTHANQHVLSNLIPVARILHDNMQPINVLPVIPDLLRSGLDGRIMKLKYLKLLGDSIVDHRMLLHLAGNILIESLRVGIANAADEIIAAEDRWVLVLNEVLLSPFD